MSAKSVVVPEQLGKRIALLRALKGWTQQGLADRLAVSRVAVSLLERDLSVPGERTVTLLAGLFKMEPWDLVAGTNYPQAKAERLPAVACRYTEMELQHALLRADLDWLAALQGDAGWARRAGEVRLRWQARLEDLASTLQAPSERELLDLARRELRAGTGVG
jgi:transcriptional regulator with XRE-family HTH domain